jgi:UTP--glucose-1-phosphate uridylyltransferase
MAGVFAQRQASVLGVETVPPTETDKYGIVATNDKQGRVSEVRQIVEKPRPQNAPSNLAVVGRYLLTPRIFDKLERTGRGAGGEIQLTDAIADLLADESVFAYEFAGKRYDCGSKLGYLQATVEYALNHDALGAKFAQYLQQLAATLPKK